VCLREKWGGGGEQGGGERKTNSTRPHADEKKRKTKRLTLNTCLQDRKTAEGKEDRERERKKKKAGK